MLFLRKMIVAAQLVVIGMIGKIHNTLRSKDKLSRNSLKFKEISNPLTLKRKRRSLKRRRIAVQPVEMLLMTTLNLNSEATTIWRQNTTQSRSSWIMKRKRCPTSARQGLVTLTSLVFCRIQTSTTTHLRMAIRSSKTS
jgi:hypothetical protein